ncbi:MAG: hypothetical protein IJ816_01590 [Alloprevotella sp.]|nr:hypothetical protein [Alloprevotella sp.]
MILSAFPLLMLGQAKKPTLMVFPADNWCIEHGYTQTFKNQGKETRVPNYEKAIQEDMDLYNVITKIGELMSDQGFPLEDLSQTIKSINQNATELEMTTSRTSGATIAETPLDRLLTRAKADIIVEVTWKVNKVGPKRSVTYTLRGLDAYTNKQVAATTGTGAPSYTAETPVLLEEAVIEKMDGFVAQLQAHFDDLLANGREVNINCRIFNNGRGLTFEDEFGGEELIEIIDNWMDENTQNHRYNLSDATETTLVFKQVRIPLYNAKGRALDTRTFTADLRKYLKTKLNIDSKIFTVGLGRADLILGEK